ncbi:hypothetical protein TgHK011_007929 [Trichoderma gracile]|nr:hypothetical protein TgHK011_007929 [Trichoderma gracile]
MGRLKPLLRPEPRDRPLPQHFRGIVHALARGGPCVRLFLIASRCLASRYYLHTDGMGARLLADVDWLYPYTTPYILVQCFGTPYSVVGAFL